MNGSYSLLDGTESITGPGAGNHLKASRSQKTAGGAFEFRGVPPTGSAFARGPGFFAALPGRKDRPSRG